MDDPSSTPGSSTFHTPEQQLQPPRPMQTPATTSDAAAVALPTTGKKRSAEEFCGPGDGDGDDSPSNQGGILGRLVMSMTPSRWKRPRSSLDSYNRSAIESVNRTPHSLGSDEGGSSGGGGGGYASDGIKSSGTKLKKMNLDKKFDDPSLNMSASSTGGGGGKMPVQQALNPGQNNAMELPVKKRVRMGNNNTRGNASGVSNNAGNQAAMTSAVAAKKVSIGGTTSFATSSPYHAFAGNFNNAGATPAPTKKSSFSDSKSPFASNTSNGPKFNIGSAAKPTLRDIRGRTATPAGKILSRRRIATPGARRGAGSTPAGGRSTARGGLARTPGGTIAAGRNLGAAGRSGAAAAQTSNAFRATVRRADARGPILSRKTGYRRRPINARSFKPMSRLLTGVYTKGNDATTDGGKKRNQSMMLTESIVSQILEENRNKLGLAGNTRNGELALFGGTATKSGDRAVDDARTFDEEAKAYRAANKAVPRVRMNRVLGSGQTGGRRFELPAESTTTSITAPAADAVVAASSTAAAPAPSVSFGKPATRQPAGSLSFGRPMAAGAPAPGRAVAFQAAIVGTAKSDGESEPSASQSFVPYAADALPPRGSDPDTRLTPCKSVQDNVSKEMGEEIERMVATDEWKREAMGADYGFGDAAVREPRKASERRRGTPHPKKGGAAAAVAASAVSTPALLRRADEIVAANATMGGSGAPFDFMPGGVAASSKVDTPSYKFGTSPTDATSSSPVEKTPKSLVSKYSPKKDSTPPVSSAAAPPATSGWGDLFKPKPGEWKCEVCSTKNPKEALKCLACETPKPGADDAPKDGSSSDNATSNAVSNAKASIGTGGFSFGAPTSSAPAPAPPTTPGGGGFTFGSSEASKEKESGGSSSSSVTFGGATPAKAKRDRDDADGDKPSIGAGGFSFGGAASNGGSGGAGFSIPAAAPANTPAKSKSKRERDDDASGSTAGRAAPSVGGFQFGAAAPAAPAPANKSLFSFGGSDEKKEDPVPASGGGFSFGTAEKKSGGGGGASIPGFSFGAPPSSNKTTMASQEKKDDTSSSEPPSKKMTTFSFGTGTPSLSVPAGNGTTPAPAGAPPFGMFGSSAPAAAPTAAESTTPAPAGAPQFGMFGSSAPAAAPTAAENTAPTPAPAGAPPFGIFGSSAPAAAPTATENTAPTPAFAFGGSAPAKSVESTGEPTGASFSFGASQAKPAVGASATPVPAFGFGAPSTSQAPSAAGGSAFAFGAAGNAASSAPATAKAPAASGTSFSFGAGPTPAAPPAFAAAPTPAAAGGFGFGNASQPAAAPTTSGAFGFGGSSTPAAPSAGFGAASTPAAGGFGFGGASQPPTAVAAAPTTPGTTFGFGNVAPAPNPTPGFAPAATTPNPGFGANVGFGATPTAMGGAASSGGGGGAFSIGTGGPKRVAGGKTPGGRRILKARRPPGTR